MILYRPVGLKELQLIAASDWRAFPPRLPEQPIFYPVLSHNYARRICVEWNSREAEAGRCGFVTQFEVEDAFAARYPVQIAGGRACQELWVPAEDLADFNARLVDQIAVVEAVYGEGFAGEIDPNTNLPIEIARRLTHLNRE